MPDEKHLEEKQLTDEKRLKEAYESASEIAGKPDKKEENKPKKSDKPSKKWLSTPAELQLCAQAR